MVRAAFAEGKEKYGWEWIIIDSISNMSAPGTTDLYQTVSHIASELLAIYQDFDIPVVGTSQIGRDVADRPKKSLEPRLTDGFGGGKIEQLANVVWGVYDHSYYVKQGMAEDNFTKYPDDTLTLIQLKGKTGRARPRVIVGVTDGAGITNVTLRRTYVNIPELTGMKAKESARREKEDVPLDMPTMA
jgi:replicative DNA helicase